MNRRLVERVLEAMSRDGLTPSFRYRRLRVPFYTGRARAVVSVLTGKPTIYGVNFCSPVRVASTSHVLVSKCVFKVDQ